MNYKKAIKEIEPYKAGLSEKSIKEKYNLAKIVKLDSNENPYGASKKINTIYSDIKAEARYPDNYCTEIRSKLAKKYNISEDSLIFGNGSGEVIQMIARALIEQNDEIITCSPTFQSCYTEMCIEYGKMISIPLTDNYRFNLEEIIKRINVKTKIIYIANPNNPTGTILTNDELKAFIEKIPSNILILLDEAYAEFVSDKNYPNSIELLKQYSNICILKTFSKAYGLASFRIGYAISSKKVINELEKVRLPFNISTIAQRVASIALEDEEFLEDVIKKNREVVELLYKKLDEYEIDYINTETNFIMIDTKNDGKVITEKLLQNGFMVRPGFPNMDTFIRVSIGTKEEMIDFVKCLNSILKEN